MGVLSLKTRESSQLLSEDGESEGAWVIRDSLFLAKEYTPDLGRNRERPTADLRGREERT